MDLTLLHPKVVHLPIALSILLPLLAAGLAVAWWRGWLPRRTWVVAVASQALLVISGFAAMQTGEIDEEPVEAVVAERLIHAHEEAAEVFVWASVAGLLVFALPIVVRNERVALALTGAALAMTVVTLGLGYRVGQRGGSLVYEHGAAQAFVRAARPEAGDVGAPPAREDDDSD